MNAQLVDQIVRAVLYEGYILYPYRPSVKNRQRWTFGGVFPESFARAQDGSDAWLMQTECLVHGDLASKLNVTVRFLHLVSRQVWVGSRPVESLEIEGTLWQTWQEATERAVDIGQLTVGDIVRRPCFTDFTFQALNRQEALLDSSQTLCGRLVRDQQALQGTVHLAAIDVGENLFRVTISISNRTRLEDENLNNRDEAMLRALVSTHSILEVSQGEFVSLIDPPAPYREAAAGCRNIGAWPVLVGNEGERDTMLLSPIILYDYPQVAPESPGDLFDGTEIDEILTLRIMTLTDGEKRAMVATDERARALLDRTESLAREQIMKLHAGTMKETR